MFFLDGFTVQKWARKLIGKRRLKKELKDEICPATGEHHQPIHNEGRGEIVCGSCGMVLEERSVQTGKGPRAFSQEQRNKRKHHGNPITPLLPDLQMATMVRKRKSLTRRLKKALRWDTRYTWRQRNLMQAISEIKRIGTHLNEPKRVEEYASKLYRKAYRKGLLKGRSIKAMVAACLYYAANKEDVPTALYKIEELSNVDRHDINICYQSIMKRLKLKSPVIDPELMISMPVANLDLPHRVEMIAHQILRLYKKRYQTSGKDPKGIVAAAVYFGVQNQDLETTQNQIVEEIGITEVTMRKRYREIQEMVEYIRKKKKKLQKKAKKKAERKRRRKERKKRRKERKKRKKELKRRKKKQKKK